MCPGSQEFDSPWIHGRLRSPAATQVPAVCSEDRTPPLCGRPRVSQHQNRELPAFAQLEAGFGDDSSTQQHLHPWAELQDSLRVSDSDGCMVSVVITAAILIKC